MKRNYDCKIKHPSKKCSVCKKPLKMNLVERKEDAELCYKCWCKENNRNPRARKENRMSRQPELRSMPSATQRPEVKNG